MKNLLAFLLLIPLISIAQTKENQLADNDTVILEDQINPKDSTVIKTEPIEKCISGDCLEGQGSRRYLSGVFIGEWKDGLRHGQGKYTWNNGDTYTGSWFEDKRHGQGVYIWHDGSKYKGNYSHGIRSGYGIYYYTNGSIYEGTWQNNLKHGIANFYYKESVNIGGRYFNNEYVGGTGITQGSYKYKPQ